MISKVRNCIALLMLLMISYPMILVAQEKADNGLLTIDRIFSGEFSTGYFGPSKWLDGGDYYTTLEASTTVNGRDIVKYNTKTNERSILVDAANLIPEGFEDPMRIANYSWSNNGKMLLLFTNTSRVWRANTKGDYYAYNLENKKLLKLGKGLPESSLMFAKFSPEDLRVAYASGGNLYVQDLVYGEIQQLTEDGNSSVFNGTFDWAYEEEFACRDGFRWSADGRYLAFWQVDASEIRNFLMLNTTDSVYSYTIPVQYPKVGEPPSKVRLGVVDLTDGQKRWLNIPTGSDWPYLPRMQWVGDTGQLLVQQLNRKQNSNRLWYCNPADGSARNVYVESDSCWVDVTHPDPTMNWDMTDPHVLDDGKAVLWTSEKDGWRHFYHLSLKDGKTKLLTRGEYDIARMYLVDEKSKSIYFNASPDNPTQRYLYRIPLKGTDRPQRISPTNQPGLHKYNISPNGRYAIHTWSNVHTPSTTELVSLPDHKLIRTLVDNEDYKAKMKQLKLSTVEFFKVTTEDGVEMDGYIRKPWNFDPAKKYPVLFNLYGEPWGQTATDSWRNPLFHEMMTQKGYLVITMDNRGTPALKGREWRKSLYRKIGVLNARDQAMATQKIMEWPFVDPSRIAVWGWSGGGSMTLNLLFRYPKIYGSGVSVAPVANQLLYDNIYQERYMGVPWENKEDFVEGSPITYAKNLEGNLMLIHGTGDDNVHYQNSEALVNELIAHNKQFSMMAYPNRSHGIYEGPNTSRHLYQLIMNYIMQNTPPGGLSPTKNPKP